MTFGDAMSMLSDRTDAAKRPNWRGYVKVTPQEEGVKKVEFWKKTTKAGEFSIAANGTITPVGAATILDGELLEAMMAGDWMVGKSAAFEACHAGTGDW